MLIGITGPAGCGKSEVARILMARFGYERVKFADPLKNMLRTMLRDVGHSDRDVERYLEGDLKESVVDGVGVTARRLMVTLGTEWGRDQIHPDLWISLWAARAERFESVLADDVRLPNEVATIRQRGGRILAIHRPGLATNTAHVSEQLVVTPDLEIVNSGSLLDLADAVHQIFATRLGLTPTV